MNNPEERFDRAGGSASFPLGKRPYLCPYFRVIDLGTLLDVCTNPSGTQGNTDPFNPNPGDGWDDEFNN